MQEKNNPRPSADGKTHTPGTNHFSGVASATNVPRGRLLDAELLRCFLAVVECKGANHAAHYLHRTQAAISQQISRLEDAVGASLFQGPKRHLKLTPTGVLLLDYARRLTALNHEAMERLQPGAVSGTVRMGATNYYATAVLPGLLAEFSSLYPRVHIDLEVGVADEMQRKLGRAYDLIINAFPSGAGRGVLLRRDAAVWAVSARSKPHERTPIPLAVLPHGSLLRKWAEDALTRVGRPWTVVQESLSVEVLKASVLAGVAVGVFQEATVQAAPQMRVLSAQEGFPELPSTEMWLDKADRELPRAARCLYAYLCEQLPPWNGPQGDRSF